MGAGRANDALTEFAENKLFLPKLLRKNLIGPMVGIHTDGPSTSNQFLNFKNLVNTIQDQINEQVYDYYSAARVIQN